MPDTSAPDAHRKDDTADQPLTSATETAEMLHAPHFEAEDEPTTLTMPIIGGGSAIVVDESDTASRSIEALTLSPRRAKRALFVLATAAFAASANEASIVALSQSIATDLAVPIASTGHVATSIALTVVAAALVAAWSTRALRLASLASLGLTAAASIVTTAIDWRMLRRLRVPRRVRRAVQGRFAMIEKRRAWAQWTRPIALRSRGRAASFTRGSARARRMLPRPVGPGRR